MSFAPSKNLQHEVAELISHYPDGESRSASLMVLHAIQDEAGYISPGQELIQPFNVQNYSAWVDFSAGLNFSNYTRDVLVDSSVIEALYVAAPEVILTAEIKENTTAFTGTTYALDLPEDYIDQHSE